MIFEFELLTTTWCRDLSSHFTLIWNSSTLLKKTAVCWVKAKQKSAKVLYSPELVPEDRVRTRLLRVSLQNQGSAEPKTLAAITLWTAADTRWRFISTMKRIMLHLIEVFKNLNHVREHFFNWIRNRQSTNWAKKCNYSWVTCSPMCKTTKLGALLQLLSTIFWEVNEFEELESDMQSLYFFSAEKELEDGIRLEKKTDWEWLWSVDCNDSFTADEVEFFSQNVVQNRKKTEQVGTWALQRRAQTHRAVMFMKQHVLLRCCLPRRVYIQWKKSEQKCIRRDWWPILWKSVSWTTKQWSLRQQTEVSVTKTPCGQLWTNSEKILISISNETCGEWCKALPTS